MDTEPVLPGDIIYTEPIYRVQDRVIVVFPEHWSQLAADERELLEKILGAVRLSASGVQILALESVTIDDLIHFNPSRVLIFGSRTAFDLADYEATEIEGMGMVKSAALKSLDTNSKRQLWDAMKEMFRVQ